VNGGGGSYADSAAAKSLEDSVKDMLRPMLRQWLDENMARVLTAALKDELRNNPARLTGD
jgi:cell pole-organizing protein PopZ